MSGKATTKRPTTLQHVATLPCEMFVLKKRLVPELSGANCHAIAKLSHLKQLLQNIHPTMLAKFCLTDEKIFTVITSKNPKNHQLYTLAATKSQQNACSAHTINVQTVTDGISQRV